MHLMRLFKKVYRAYGHDEIPLLSASLAFYSILSLSPLLVIILVLSSMFLSEAAVANAIVREIQSVIGARAAELVGTIIHNAAQPSAWTFTSVISLFIILIGAAGVFGHLQYSLNRIYGVEKKSGLLHMIKRNAFSFAIVLGVGGLLVISLVLGAWFTYLENTLYSLTGIDILLEAINLMSSILIVTMIFAVTYKFIPSIKHRWGEVLPGALVAAILFTFGRVLIGLYLSHSSIASVYGAAGSVIVLLVWGYYSSQIFFVGAEINKARKH